MVGPGFLTDLLGAVYGHPGFVELIPIKETSVSERS